MLGGGHGRVDRCQLFAVQREAWPQPPRRFHPGGRLSGSNAEPVDQQCDGRLVAGGPRDPTPFHFGQPGLVFDFELATTQLGLLELGEEFRVRKLLDHTCDFTQRHRQKPTDSLRVDKYFDRLDFQRTASRAGTFGTDSTEENRG